eukprot:4257969-Amphidinium_carterae.2
MNPISSDFSLRLRCLPSAEMPNPIETSRTMPYLPTQSGPHLLDPESRKHSFQGIVVSITTYGRSSKASVSSSKYFGTVFLRRQLRCHSAQTCTRRFHSSNCSAAPAKESGASCVEADIE